MHAGPVFALARIQEYIVEELFSAYLPDAWGNPFWCEYMPCLRSHPRENRKIFLSCLCLGLMPEGVGEKYLHGKMAHSVPVLGMIGTGVEIVCQGSPDQGPRN